MNNRRTIVTVALTIGAIVALACGGTSNKDDKSSDNGQGNAQGGNPPGSFGDGTFAVGSDIDPGVYQATVPDTSLNCYWQISKDDTGNLESVVANDNLSPKAHGLIEVAGGQFVKSSGCGRWAPATNPGTPAKTIDNGTYRVGIDVAEGSYTTDVPADSVGCYWQTSTDGSGMFASIVANENLEPGAHGRVTLNSGQWFKSSKCGIWKTA